MPQGIEEGLLLHAEVAGGGRFRAKAHEKLFHQLGDGRIALRSDDPSLTVSLVINGNGDILQKTSVSQVNGFSRVRCAQSYVRKG